MDQHAQIPAVVMAIATLQITVKCWKADPRTNTYWIGADCSMRECPRGPAWTDKAIESTMHTTLLNVPTKEPVTTQQGIAHAI